jgi:hypothetical protein
MQGAAALRVAALGTIADRTHALAATHTQRR